MATAANPVLGNYDVARDLDGVRTAARELFEEALKDAMAEKLRARLRDGANASRAASAVASPSRTLGGGYYAWVEYLFELEGMSEAGIRFSATDLQAREVDGLRVVRSERDRFRAAHPSCPECGSLLPNRVVQACWNCNKRFERKK